MTAETTAGFDALIHAPHRLQICAILDTVGEAEFGLLRERLRVSESVLSKQVKALEEAGYVAIRKASRDGRVRTWARHTAAGRAAYRGHVAALRAIVGAG